MENLNPIKITITRKFYQKILTLALLPQKVWPSIGATHQGEMFLYRCEKGIHFYVPELSTACMWLALQTVRQYA